MFRTYKNLLISPALAFILLSICLLPVSGESTIVFGSDSTPIEQYAAKELQRYLYLLTGEKIALANSLPKTGSVFIVGQPNTNPVIRKLIGDYGISITPDDPGPQGYLLKKLSYNGRELLVIAGCDDMGVLYGVYGLLDDCYGVGFYFGGDVLPDKKPPLKIADVDERKAPRQYIRGMLPWTNFPQSATIYSFDDYRYIIDQMAKMRMNFLHIHNYNGMLLHNEPFHNFTYNGVTSRVWMPSVKTGHKWAGAPWDIENYLFGAYDLFDDYDFTSECGLHNESLDNWAVYQKGYSLFQKVIDYAHLRGVKVGLGLDISQIMPEYGVPGDDPGLVDARVDEIIERYPDLDYLICFRFEGIKKAGGEEAFIKVFHQVYNRIRKDAPQIKIAVSGWGLDKQAIEPLPRDIIIAPIAGYSSGFESGTIYGDREYWSCPWLERDGKGSQYYYPYGTDLSASVAAYHNRARNMKGMYTLTWRLTDAVDAKMMWVAKAPWDLADRYKTSRDVYYDYAVENYGLGAANAITNIIDENEPFACLGGECAPTGKFTGADRSKDIMKAKDQLRIIDYWLARTGETGPRERLKLLRERIESVKVFCEMDRSFPDITWDKLPGGFDIWAESFIDRVTDISSLGNVTSSQNRWVQLRYLAKENELREKQPVKAPSYVHARGTSDGAVITWRNEEPAAHGFNVYQDGIKLNLRPLPASSRSFTTIINGKFKYAVTALNASGNESPKSVSSGCAAGSADIEGPKIIAVSSPTSAFVGQPVVVKVRVLDNRNYDHITAAVYYRVIGGKSWGRIPMNRRVKAVFTATIPASAVSGSTLEYYISAYDGSNTGFFPADAPNRVCSVIAEPTTDLSPPPAPEMLAADGSTIRWKTAGSDVFQYRIYRGTASGFISDPSNLLTYVQSDTTEFKDLADGFDCKPLEGTYYYRVTSVDKYGNESSPGTEIAIAMGK